LPEYHAPVFSGCRGCFFEEARRWRKMRYSFIARARPRLDQPIKDKHQDFVARIMAMADPWPFADGYPPPPELGPDLVAVVVLKPYLRKGVTGRICYSARYPGLEDRASSDDYFVFDFSPRKQDYAHIVKHVFPSYVLAFEAYRAQIMDVRCYSSDFEAKRQVDDRHGVYKVFPVAYLDGELCARALQLSPEEVVLRLRGAVEEVSLLGGGVFIVARSQVVSVEEAAAVNSQLQAILRG
jgi:hypothetical protein